jgi:hypothetical protein
MIYTATGGSVVQERVVRFGPEKRLVGILTEPRSGGRGRPGTVLLNSGLVHRIGASRIYVHMARALARQGMSALRFDFSGIGDSEARRDGLTFEEAAVQEIRDAMDVLTGRGMDQFILAGLCSGADMAFYGALADERVVGIAQLDPFVYRTQWYYVRRYLPRMKNLTSWLNLVSGRNVLGRRLRGIRTSTSHDAPSEDVVPTPYWRAFPPREEVAAGLRTLAARRVRMLDMFTADQPEHYSYGGQYRRVFSDVPFGDLLTEIFYPDADHIFTGPAPQQRMVEHFRTWAGTFAPRQPAPVTLASAVAQ